MIAKKNNGRCARMRKGGIGTYGTHPWEADYDHVSFLSEMIPVSFESVGMERFGGMPDGGASGGVMAFSMDNAVSVKELHGIRA